MTAFTDGLILTVQRVAPTRCPISRVQRPKIRGHKGGNQVTPKRIQQRRTKGWRMPLGAKSVARPSKWGNPFRVGRTQVRMPALDGSDWELEGRLYKTSGQRHPYNHADGHYTWHAVEDATPQQVVDLYRLHTGPLGMFEFEPGALDELRGLDLACWCPLDQPCHADVLLELANR